VRGRLRVPPSVLAIPGFSRAKPRDPLAVYHLKQRCTRRRVTDASSLSLFGFQISQIGEQRRVGAGRG